MDLNTSYFDFSYRAARISRIKSVVYSGTDGDSHIDDSQLDRMREACRQLDRDNCIASSILDRAIENIVGSGIKLKIRSGNKSWDKKAQQLWDEYWEFDSDIRGMHSGGELEALMLRAKFADGDMLIIKSSTGQVQLIESDRLRSPVRDSADIPATITVDNKVVKIASMKSGVAMDSVGKPLAFFVTESSDRNSNVGRWISADNCIFFGNFKRSSLTRGIPSFAVNLQMFEDLDAFIEATVISAKINAAVAMTVTRKDGGASLDNVETETDTDGNTRQLQEWNPGTIIYGQPGEEVKMLSATNQLVGFSEFVTQILRFAGLPFGLPLEATSLDFSKTTYSSARAALLLAHKAWKLHHQSMVRVLRKILLWKVETWVADRTLRPPRGTVGVTATPPVAIQIDPMKETIANVAKQKHSFTTNRDISSAQGENYLELMEQRAKEISEAQNLVDQLNKKYPDANIVWQNILGSPDKAITFTPNMDIEGAEEDQVPEESDDKKGNDDKEDNGVRRRPNKEDEDDDDDD